MAIEILLEGNLKPVSSQEKFTAFLEHFCHHKHLKFEDYGNVCIIEVCPEGTIECSYENDFVTILAQTNVAGPGFHAFACDILSELQEESDVELEANDPTGYIKDHDFENLKYDYFYKWLSSIANYVEEHRELENLCISWPLHYYRPQAKEGSIVTPMGYIRIEDFTNSEVKDLAEQFFIWNEQGMNAKFYHNCALNLIWKECYFEYSGMNEYTEKTAWMIMDYLELAHEQDAAMPLPLGTYQLLADTVHRENLLHKAIAYQDQHLGYRRHSIRYELENWSIPVDGFSEIYQDQERGSAQIMNGYHEEEVWHWMMQIDIQQKSEFDAIFSETSSFIIDSQTLETASYHGKCVTLNYGEHFEIFAQLINEREQLLIRYRTIEASYVSKGMDIIKGIQHLHVDDETIKH